VKHPFERRSPWTTILYDSFRQTADILFNTDYYKEIPEGQD
jgi:hypothetical protein